MQSVFRVFGPIPCLEEFQCSSLALAADVTSAPLDEEWSHEEIARSRDWRQTAVKARAAG